MFICKCAGIFRACNEGDFLKCDTFESSTVIQWLVNKPPLSLPPAQTQGSHNATDEQIKHTREDLEQGLWFLCPFSASLSPPESAHTPLCTSSLVRCWILPWLFAVACGTSISLHWEMHRAPQIQLSTFTRFRSFSLEVNIMIPADFNEHWAGPWVQLSPHMF